MASTAFTTPLARPVDLTEAWNASDADLAELFHPRYSAALGRLPDGPSVFRGLPFSLGTRAVGRRWILLDAARELEIDLRDLGPASHVVVAHFCDSWRDASGRRPAGTPVGWVVPTGEPLARYELDLAEGSTRTIPVRRRYEVVDGIIGWGYLPFAAVGHRADEPLDWRGPHPRLEPGRYAPAGHAGPLTMLPGSWGAGQTGVADFVPTRDDDITYWLHAIRVDADGRSRELRSLRMTALGGGRPGADVAVAAVTLFDGTADPLVLAPRRQVRLTGEDGGMPQIDLGVAIGSRPLPRRAGVERGGPIGWGRPSLAGRAADAQTVDAPAPPAALEDTPADPPWTLVDLALAADARLRFGDWQIAARDLGSGATSPDGRLRVEPLAAADIRVKVTVTADGEPAPSRVRFVAADGRYLPPLGHREEINPGIREDSGAGLILGLDTFAYVPGEFAIDLPPGAVEIEVVKGFDHRPVRRRIDVEPGLGELRIDLQRAIDLRSAGWRASDSHVHFLSPSTALVQAAAEDVTWVHLLATQWGDENTSVTDLPWGSVQDPTGRHAVIVGSENRQVMLGHLALLGARRPILPFASGGSPEGRLGAPTTELLADWADRCHAEGGLVVGAHFPLPFAEIAADIVAGRIDALEFQVFAPGLDHPPIREWYRVLNCGYRIPVLGGTDKMSAEIPVGAVRTYARLDPDAEPTFEAWAAAVRAGRTFATSGPVLELSVGGQEPGSVISLPAGGGTLAVEVRARAAQAVIRSIEVVVNGRVVAREDAPADGDDLRLATEIRVEAGSWIAARALSGHEIHSAFNTSMAAHTSAVYVDVVDRPLFVADEAAGILELIDGTVHWLQTMATVGDPALRARLAARVAASATTLRERVHSAQRGRLVP
ncbi:MAG: CehA/McbA family metallohydrolase [Candidatus Limnocylindrales bacterium]